MRFLSILKYYSFRFFGGLISMGSFTAGIFSGVKWGLWAGVAVFITVFTVGIMLHIVAKKIRQSLERK